MTTITESTPLDWFFWFDYVGKVATAFHRTYPSIDVEDLEQELSTLLVEKEDALTEANISESYIKAALSNCAKNYCKREVSTALHFSDKYIYRNETVRSLLDDWFSHKDKLRVPEDAEKDRPDDALAIYCDVSRAFDSLTEKHQNTLTAKYWDGEDFTGPTERKQLQRAVDAMTERLNRGTRKRADHNGPGARKVIKNITAVGMNANADH